MIMNKTIAIKRDTMKNNIWVDVEGNKYNATGVIDATNKNGRRSVIVGQFTEENGQVIFLEIFGYNAGMRR